MMYGDIKSNWTYFTEINAIYLPELRERKVDCNYIKGLLEDNFTTIKKKTSQINENP